MLPAMLIPLPRRFLFVGNRSSTLVLLTDLETFASPKPPTLAPTSASVLILALTLLEYMSSGLHLPAGTGPLRRAGEKTHPKSSTSTSSTFVKLCVIMYFCLHKPHGRCLSHRVLLERQRSQAAQSAIRSCFWPLLLSHTLLLFNLQHPKLRTRGRSVPTSFVNSISRFAVSLFVVKIIAHWIVSSVCG